MYIVTAEESEKNLEDVMSVCTKFAHFKSEIKREMNEHPDYRVERLTLNSTVAYIILAREHLGVIHSTCLEVKFDRSKD